MRSLGAKADGARLERMEASAMWRDDRFRNIHPILPGLRHLNATMPKMSDSFAVASGAPRCTRFPL
jgi:hypothetical protein